jgi:DNA-binding CsgD family transcriptional regulator
MVEVKNTPSAFAKSSAAIIDSVVTPEDTSSGVRGGLHMLAAAASLNGVDKALGTVSEAMGCRRYLVTLIFPTSFTTPKSIVFSNYPSDWRRTYVQMRFARIDPAVTHCRLSTLPIIWEMEAETSHEYGPAFDELLSGARSHGIKAGVSFPIRGSGGEWGMLNLNWGEERLADETLGRILRLGGVVASLAHLAARNLLFCDSRFPDFRTLSQREIACLKWSAEGKTSWETAQILGITERTVNFHNHNAMEKIGAVNKRQAATLAATFLAVDSALFDR